MTEKAYDVVNLRPLGGGPFQPHARAHCANCTMTVEFQVNGSPPPEHIAKKIRAKGWEFDIGNRRYTRCPDCIRLRDASRKGESPGPKTATVELFGKPVSLPVTVVPPDLVPPPPPVREPRVLKDASKEAEPALPMPTPEYGLQQDIRKLVGVVTQLAIENNRLRTDISELIVALKAQVARPPTVVQYLEPQPIFIKNVDETPTPRAPRETAKPKARNAMQQRAQDYGKRVQEALIAIRKKKTNGRPPSLHEYIKGLNQMGVEPFRPGRPWSATIVQKHLTAIDAN